MTDAHSRRLVPVILCGGSGARLWPASRQDFPKQFLKIAGEYSLLQNTIQRAMNLPGVDASGIVMVTTSELHHHVKADAMAIHSDLDRHIVIEPSARNTAPAIALATRYVMEHFGPSAVMCILPSDHHIGREDNFKTSIMAAVTLTDENNIVTFGIKPNTLHPDYGHIIAFEEYRAGVYRIDHFKEKPSREEAEILCNSGTCFWNSGMFVMSVQSALSHYREHSKTIYGDIIVKNSDITQGYHTVENISFDHAIIEKSRDLLVIPSNLDWSDVGSWDSIWNLHPKDSANNVVLGAVTCVESEGCYVHSCGKMIAISGLKDIVIVETEDAIMISHRKETRLHRKLAEKVRNSMTPLLSSLKSKEARYAS